MKRIQKKNAPIMKPSLLCGKGLKRFAVKHWQIVSFFMTLYDLAAVNGAYFFALWMRYDFKFTTIPQNYLNAWLEFVPLYTVFAFALLLALRLYRSIWRFAGYRELFRVFEASAAASVFHAVVITLLFERMPLSYYIVGAGAAGQMLLRDLYSAKETNERVCCIIDDNSNKWGRCIDGVPVVGCKYAVALSTGTALTGQKQRYV